MLCGPHDKIKPLFIVTGGCSLNNGGCEKFCFTLPHPNNPFSVSSEYTCACPTGFKLLADNTSCNLGKFKSYLFMNFAFLLFSSRGICSVGSEQQD